MALDLVFLGFNDAGKEIYDWLVQQEEVNVRALLTTKEQLELVKEIQPEIAVSVGYRHIVPKEIIEIPERGILNLHPSFLPYGRGANPNVWSIVEDDPAGVTLHFMDEDLDTGEVIAQERVDKKFSDTGKDLHKRLEKAQVELFKENWTHIVNNSLETETQERDEGTYHESAEFDEICEIDLDEEYRAEELLSILRALTFPPYKNAYVEKNGEKYYIQIDIEKAEETE